MVDEENSDDGHPAPKLDDLPRGQILLPPHLLPKRDLHEVGVHADVDQRVDEGAPEGALEPRVREPRPGDEEHRGVVPQVQQRQLLLPQAEDDRVEQLVVLGQVVHVGPVARGAVPDLCWGSLPAQEPVHQAFLADPPEDGAEGAQAHGGREQDEEPVVEGLHRLDVHRLRDGPRECEY
eukprot:CAMPEP_0172587104 /NCGR_PEP_ID=MMETSP1068-20121228/6231_1 /TAXON_ID=35684 /ORGANISM="Pseudopedinella elastica, Strain CCMP716" /LENGTH=178 /DNA_ID=CAMNT_0013382023 /DNA_START=297 /DNA_END=833 /DNA_ORIENTATION=+